MPENKYLHHRSSAKYVMHVIFVYFGGFHTNIKCARKIHSKSENPHRSATVWKFHAYERLESLGYENCVHTKYSGFAVELINGVLRQWGFVPPSSIETNVDVLCNALCAMRYRAWKCYVTAPQPAKQPTKLVLNKDSVPYKSMLGDRRSIEKRSRTCPIPDIFWNLAH